MKTLKNYYLYIYIYIQKCLGKIKFLKIEIIFKYKICNTDMLVSVCLFIFPWQTILKDQAGAARQY